MTLFSTCGEGEGIPIPDTENIGLIELNFWKKSVKKTHQGQTPESYIHLQKGSETQDRGTY